MSDEIIVVKQLPVIVEKLEQIKTEVTEKVKLATTLVCTDETVKEVKKARAELNKEFKSWEEKRKEVKNAVMSPYEQFETVYKDCVTDTYKAADSELKRKIDSVESELKAKKQDEVKEYFDEYLLSKGIDFITFADTNLNITLSASVKSLKEQAKYFVDCVCDDLNLIEVQEHKAEILVEYKQSLNLLNAITSVTKRLNAIEEEKKRQEELATHQGESKQQTPQPIIEAPKVEEEEKQFTLRFKVTATKTKLKELKMFLDNGGYEYE
jgi:hypothetical protein